MALQVSTHLWLGGEVSEHRDEKLLTRLIERIRGCALCRPLLFCVNGWRTYVLTIQNGFREAIRTRTQGRPTLRP